MAEDPRCNFRVTTPSVGQAQWNPPPELDIPPEYEHEITVVMGVFFLTLVEATKAAHPMVTLEQIKASLKPIYHGLKTSSADNKQSMN